MFVSDLHISNVVNFRDASAGILLATADLVVKSSGLLGGALRRIFTNLALVLSVVLCHALEEAVITCEASFLLIQVILV